MPDWSKALHGNEVTWIAKLVPPSIWLAAGQHAKVIFLLKAFYWFIPAVGWMKRIVKYNNVIPVFP